MTDPAALPSLSRVQQLIGPLFPGLMGVTLTELAAHRVVATLRVRPDLCTADGSWTPEPRPKRT